MRNHSVKSTAKILLSRAVLDSAVAPIYMRARDSYQHTRYLDRCDIVVDGFPRSANTYAWYALKTVLEPKYVVRGHTHSVETLRAAIRAQKPAILLLRDPDSSVASYYQMMQNVSLSACYTAYARYHERCASLKADVYIAQFDEVIDDFGAVLAKCYEQFSLDWPIYVKNETNEHQVMDAIEHSNRRMHNGILREERVARPSPKRRSASEVVANLTEREMKARDRAYSAYRELTS